MLLLKGQSADSSAKMYRLWVHEVYRVFYDRLVDKSDRESIFAFIKVNILLSLPYYLPHKTLASNTMLHSLAISVTVTFYIIQFSIIC